MVAVVVVVVVVFVNRTDIYITILNISTFSPFTLATPLLTVFDAQFIVSLSYHEDVKAVVFNTVAVDYCTPSYNLYTSCIPSLCTAHRNCRAETNSLYSCVDL
jgi:hypothetical protein